MIQIALVFAFTFAAAEKSDRAARDRKDRAIAGLSMGGAESLFAKGVRHTWVETPGAHSFRVWRRYLAEFLPLLFRDGK